LIALVALAHKPSAFDNAIPHLLTDADLQQAAQELRAKTRPGGLLLSRTHHYDALLQERPQATPYRIIETPERNGCSDSI